MPKPKHKPPRLTFAPDPYSGGIAEPKKGKKKMTEIIKRRGDIAGIGLSVEQDTVRVVSVLGKRRLWCFKTHIKHSFGQPGCPAGKGRLPADENSPIRVINAGWPDGK